jgi:hypothetical protein
MWPSKAIVSGVQRNIVHHEIIEDTWGIWCLHDARTPCSQYKTIFEFPLWWRFTLWSSVLWLHFIWWVDNNVHEKHTGYTLGQKKNGCNTFLWGSGKHTPATWCHITQKTKTWTIMKCCRHLSCNHQSLIILHELHNGCCWNSLIGHNRPNNLWPWPI